MATAILFDSDLDLIKSIGDNVETARKRRNLRVVDVCDAANISKRTYQRLSHGHPGTSIGVLIAVLHALSLEESVLGIASPMNDDVGIAMSKRELNSKKRIHKERPDELDTNF